MEKGRIVRRLHTMGTRVELQLLTRQGAVALLSFTMLWLTSVRYVRRMAWELFLALHVLFTL